MPDQDTYEAGYEDGRADATTGDTRPVRALPMDRSYLAGYQSGVIGDAARDLTMAAYKEALADADAERIDDEGPAW